LKQYNNWYVPDKETTGIRDIIKEWNNKGKAVVDMLPQHRTVVQAGGNLGVFPKGLAKYFDRVITFEPIQSNLECLVKNIDNIENIDVHNYALGAENTQASFKSTIQGNCGATQISFSTQGDISVIPLDSLELEDVDLLWLDVEGTEVEALNGAIETIERCRPIIVAENNGLIPAYPSGLEGSPGFRSWVEHTFGYVYTGRLMRDDIFKPV
jgi:FkbM family methyltransferase